MYFLRDYHDKIIFDMLIFISNRDWQDRREVGLIFGKMQSII